AFRAREREELLPTFHQLQRKNSDVVMKWFARGRLWESPEAAQAAQRAPKPPVEKRGREWRPGGDHRDPRDRFKKRSPKPFSAQRAAGSRKPWQRDRPVERAEAQARRKRETPPSPPAEPIVTKPTPPEKD